jgi:methyl-accepting chemotaxis protein
MNLDTALEKHAEWKTKFRTAITQMESLDADTITKDNCCELGKWLYGESITLFGRLESHKDCIAKHKVFHIEAGKIATAINLRKYAEAEAMLDINTPYFKASNETGVAIIRLQKEIGSNTAQETKKKNADFFNWSNELSVGNLLIDNDHKRLIKMINRFQIVIQEGRGNDVIDKVFNNLYIYTTEHFKREEDEMLRIKYPMFKDHKMEHEEFLIRVENLHNDLINGKMMLTTKMSNFLKDWWYTHILQTDTLLAAALKKHANQ